MEKLQRMSEAEYSGFVRVLFGLSSPAAVALDLEKIEELGAIEWVDATLNDSQKDAIRFALASREIALIHGPPGVRDRCSSPVLYLYMECTRAINLRSGTSANVEMMLKDWQDAHID